jgi:hypothetical protein
MSLDRAKYKQGQIITVPANITVQADAEKT